MSKTIYPNSATRKLYGQAGKALERQNKRFLSVQQRIAQEARDKELKIRESADQKLTSEIAAFKKTRKRILIGAAIVITVLIVLLLVL